MSRLLALLALVGLVLAGLHYRREGAIAMPGVESARFREIGERLGPVGDAVGGTLRDTRLTAKVKAAFELNRTLEPHDVEISADGDTVVLRGEVPSEDVRAAAGRVAADVPDVKQVRNEIRVAGAAGAPRPTNAGGPTPAPDPIAGGGAPAPRPEKTKSSARMPSAAP